MLHSTSLLAVVGSGDIEGSSPRRLKLYRSQNVSDDILPSNYNCFVHVGFNMRIGFEFGDSSCKNE